MVREKGAARAGLGDEMNEVPLTGGFPGGSMTESASVQETQV